MHCCRGEIDLSGQNQPDSVTWVTWLAQSRSWDPQDLLDEMEEKQAGPACTAESLAFRMVSAK
jgi:hypothetical protein